MQARLRSPYVSSRRRESTKLCCDFAVYITAIIMMLVTMLLMIEDRCNTSFAKNACYVQVMKTGAKQTRPFTLTPTGINRPTPQLPHKSTSHIYHTHHRHIFITLMWGAVGQWLERATDDQVVVGSNPTIAGSKLRPIRLPDTEPCEFRRRR